MKVKLQRDDLQQAVNFVERFVPTKPYIPTLEGILCSTSNGCVEFCANDLENGALFSVPADIEACGEAVVPAKRLSSIVARLPSGSEVEITAEGEAVRIDCQDSSFTLNTYPASDFPPLQNFEPTIRVEFDADTLAEAVRRTQFAAANPVVYPRYGGIFLIGSESKVTALALDGYRISIYSFLCECSDFTVLVPAKPLSDAVKLFKQTKKVNFTANETTAKFQFDNVAIVTRLFGYSPPDCREIAVKNCSAEAVFDRVALLNALSKAMLFREGKEKGVLVNMSISGNTAVVKVESSEGSYTEKLNISGTGSAAVAFNAAYLQDALRVCSSDDVKLQFSGSLIGVLDLNCPNYSYFFAVSNKK